MGNNPCAYEKVSSDENLEISEKDQELLQISAEEGFITHVPVPAGPASCNACVLCTVSHVLWAYCE